MRDIRGCKRLKGKEHVLDHMGSTELAANLSRKETAQGRAEEGAPKRAAGSGMKRIGV